MNETYFLDKEQLNDSIETYLYHHRAKNKIIYWTVLFFITALIVALPFIYVDITVQSSGVVRPSGEIIRITAPMT